MSRATILSLAFFLSAFVAGASSHVPVHTHTTAPGVSGISKFGFSLHASNVPFPAPTKEGDAINVKHQAINIGKLQIDGASFFLDSELATLVPSKAAHLPRNHFSSQHRRILLTFIISRNGP